MKLSHSAIVLLTPILPLSVQAQTFDTECVMRHIKQGNDDLTIKDVRQACAENIQTTITSVEADKYQLKSPPRSGAISDRRRKEAQTELEPYVITPHHMSYFLPVITTSNINKDAYGTFQGYEDNLEDIEAKFQISLKAPLNNGDLLFDNDALFFGFTIQAWWQLYSSNISKPFRETNYKPEFFYYTPTNWHPLGGNTSIVLGVEHQSNGRGQPLSRSWNRVYSQFLFEKDQFAFSFRPWYRLEEDKKSQPNDSKGDDNPDIADYMGHFELGVAYKWEKIELGFLGRQNFDTGKGAATVTLTFPLWGKLRGYASVFNGYGESLIDYNHHQTRFGIGIALNNIL